MSAFHRCDNCGKECYIEYSVKYESSLPRFSPWHNAYTPILHGEFCSLACVIERANKVTDAIEKMNACGPIDADKRAPFEPWKEAMKALEVKPT